MNKSKNKIGLWTATALVAGNMIGSGVFLTPSALASYGPISIFGWVVSGAGALCLAYVFSELSKKMQASSGGPYAYSRSGLGDFAGFLVAWGYWISIWCSNAAIIVALVSYLGYFFPVLNQTPVVAILTGQAILWTVTYLNTRGLKEAGYLQIITTALKITPLLLVGVVGLFYIDIENFTPLNTSGESGFSALTAAAAFTLFSFLGIESATVPAGDVDQPEKTIPRATYVGLGVTFLVYILGSISIMGMIPSDQLAQSPFPYSEAAEMMWGPWGGSFVTLGAVFSTLGALNGWILIQGQIPAASAADKMFPEIFGKKNRNGVPAIGLIISSIFVSIMMLMNYSEGLVSAYSFFLLLSTFLVLIPYLFSIAAYGIFLADTKGKSAMVLKIIIASLAFAFSVWAMLGSGAETVYYGFVILVLGIPMYVYMLYRRKKI